MYTGGAARGKIILAQQGTQTPLKRGKEHSRLNSKKGRPPLYQKELKKKVKLTRKNGNHTG